MPRRQAGARIYLHPTEQVWVIRDGSKFKRTGYGRGEREQAEAALADYIANREPPRRSGPAHPNELTVGEVLARYVEDRAIYLKSAATIANNVTHLAGWWGNLTCDAVKGTTCRMYEQHRAEPRTDANGRVNTAGPGTVRRELSILQAALSHAHKEGLLVYPLRVTLPQAGAPRDRWLTRDEVARLIRHASPHTQRFILLSAYTGRRMTAVLELTWTRVDLEAGRIRFLAEGQRETNKRRGSVRIPRQLHGHLRRWHANAKGGETHVVSYHGRSAQNLRKSVAAARRAAGLDEAVTCHSLKHTAVTWAIMRGLSVESAAEYFDTTPSTIRRHYWHHSPHHQAEGLAAMERRSG